MPARRADWDTADRASAGRASAVPRTHGGGTGFTCGEGDSHQCGAHIPYETPAPAVAQPELEANAPEVAAKASREFYNDVTRRLEQSGVGAASFFLNHGYVSVGDGDEARFEVPPQVFNRNSVRLASELIGSTQLHGRRVLDVGCGRGGTVALLAETFGASARAWTFRLKQSRSAARRMATRRSSK